MSAIDKDTEKSPGGVDTDHNLKISADRNLEQVDAAWKFLDDHRDAANFKESSVDLGALRRKIDWHIVPLMFCCYTMQFLDKVILNYAGVMTIRQDLNLQGNDFSNVATFLFVGLLCFEIPNGKSQKISSYGSKRERK